MPHTPMQAVEALFTGTKESKAIFDKLSRAVFENPAPGPSPTIKRRLAPLVSRILKRTTRTEQATSPDGHPHTQHRNKFLERTKYPYALTILHTSDAASANLVEGGAPMNAPYMMLIPEIRSNAKLLDKLFLDSVIARDVQLRFYGETHATYHLAKTYLDQNPEQPIHIKAAAAGTGLSMLLVHQKLIQEGYPETRLKTHITDRAPSNTAKTKTLAKALNLHINAYPEDILAADPPAEKFQIITLIGILEYFIGETATTTEELQGHPAPKKGEAPSAHLLFQKAAQSLAPSAHLITNTFRPEPGARLLENFGKHFRYRLPENVTSLAKPNNLKATKTQTTGHIYDVIALKLGNAAAPSSAP